MVVLELAQLLIPVLFFPLANGIDITNAPQPHPTPFQLSDHRRILNLIPKQLDKRPHAELKLAVDQPKLNRFAIKQDSTKPFFEQDVTKKIPIVAANQTGLPAKDKKTLDNRIVDGNVAKVEKRILSETNGTLSFTESKIADSEEGTSAYFYSSLSYSEKPPSINDKLVYKQNFRAEKHHNISPNPHLDSKTPYKPKYPATPYFGMCRLEDFEYDSKEDKIGRGGFGKVYLAHHRPTGIAVALKQISVQSIKKNSKHVENEETIHHAISHPYFTKHLCTMKDENGDIYFAMELVPGKNLAKRLFAMHPIPRDTLAKMMAQLVIGLEYLHSHCIVYRDLKAENILLAPDGTVKITDFGLSGYDCDGQMSNIAGTLEYTAPEMAARKKYGREIDWYSLGVLLYSLKQKKLPLTRRAIADRELFLKKVANGLNFESTNDPAADDLIAKLTEKDPKERWGISPESRKKIRDHQFFKSIDWNEIEGRAKCVVQYPQLIMANELSKYDEESGLLS